MYKELNRLTDIIYDETGSRLEEMLLQLEPEGLPGFLEAQRENLYAGERPFTDYMRAKFKEKGILQQDVFLSADLSERYGYKLISGYKRTANRDTVLRLCLAAGFRLEEVQEALILYGMAPLYVRIPRDAAFIIAFNRRIYDIHDVDAMLRDNRLPPFLT